MTGVAVSVLVDEVMGLYSVCLLAGKKAKAVGNWRLAFGSSLEPRTGLRDCRGHPERGIADFAMPEMSGIELLERARAKRPEIRAAFITGNADQPWLSEKFTGEVVVTKPFTMEQLALAVRRSLGQPEE